MPGKVERYRARLRELDRVEAWEELLLEGSALPGPRANLELLEAVVLEGDRELFLALLDRAPAAVQSSSSTDPRREFLAACGAAGLGRLLAEGDGGVLSLLRLLAGDPRWRVREGVAMALQRWGLSDPQAMLSAMRDWSRGTRLEQRAVVAGLCEPALLSSPEPARETVALLDCLTGNIEGAPDRRSEEYRVLRKALAYGWSVAAVADLESGLPAMERWLCSGDPDVRWVMRQNLGKARLQRAAPEWVARFTGR